MQSTGIREHYRLEAVNCAALPAGCFYLTRLSSTVSRTTSPSLGTTTLSSEDWKPLAFSRSW